MARLPDDLRRAAVRFVGWWRVIEQYSERGRVQIVLLAGAHRPDESAQKPQGHQQTNANHKKEDVHAR